MSISASIRWCPGAKRRCLETVAELRFIYFDLDLQNIKASREEVIRRLRALPFAFTWGHDSGSGNLHVGIETQRSAAAGHTRVRPHGDAVETTR